MMSRLKNSIETSIQIKQKILADQNMIGRLEDIINLLTKRLKSGSRVFWCGNGGSAADAQHLSSELSGRFYKNRDPLNSEALHVNSSYLTAVANDFSFDEVYARALLAKADEGDVLICLTTSGKSKNIINAIRQASVLNLHVICFTGENGTNADDLCEHIVKIPSQDTPRIQEVHMLLGHIICEHIEANLFPE